ncbi:hypothetical protein REPUB_Repub01dG0226900 [Reevesia pubescens]
MVAQANITSNNNFSPVPSIVVHDDPFTIGLEPTSEIIGNAQGLQVLAGRDTTTVMMYMDYGFTKVVGGRGKFKMAKGFALLKTYSLDNISIIVEYNVTDCITRRWEIIGFQ